MGLNNPGIYKGVKTCNPTCQIINGGFETGDYSGWEFICGGVICNNSVITGGAPEGNQYANLKTKYHHHAGTNILRQRMNNCCLENRHIHFWYRAGDIEPSSGVTFGVTVYRINGAYHGFNLSYPIGWTQIDVQLASDYTFGDYYIEFYTRDLSSGEVFFDLDDIYFH